MGHNYVTARNDAGARKFYLFSGQFTTTIKTSSFFGDPQSVGFDGVNTPFVETPTSTEKLILLSGQFGSTVKSSLAPSGQPGRQPSGISWDGTDTPWSGTDNIPIPTVSILFLQSGQFSSTVKASLRTGASPFDVDISADGVNTPRATPDKLFLQSGQFSSTVKDSEDVSAVETAVAGISFNGVDTPWSGQTGNGRFYLQSGQLTSTIKTSADIGLSAGTIGGIDTTGVTTGVDITGTILAATAEADIVAGGKIITITLISARLPPNLDTWDATVGDDSAATTALLAGLVSSGAESNGWNTQVSPALDFNDVVRTSDSIVTITLPAVAGYDVALTEAVTLTVPAAALTNGADPIVADPSFAVQPDVVGGDSDTSFFGSNGFNDAILVLYSGQFSSTVKDSQPIAGNFNDGAFDGTNSPWVDQGQPGAKLGSGRFTATIKTSANWSSVDASIFGMSYDGADSLSAGQGNQKLYLISGQFTTTIKTSEPVGGIDTVPRGIAWDGTNTVWSGDTANKLYLTSGKFTSTIKTSVSTAAQDSFPRSVTFSSTTGDTPWDGAGTGKLYLFSGQFSTTLHDSLLVTGQASFGGNGIDVGDRLPAGGPPAAFLSGSVVVDLDEQDIRDGGRSILLTLTGDTWDATAGADNAITQAIIDGLLSAGSEGIGWNAIVRAGLNASHVDRVADTIISIDLPPFTGYDISADETINVTIPASALVTSSDPLTTTPLSFSITFIAIGRPAPRRIISADQLKEYVTFISPGGERYALNTPHQFGRWVISYSGLGTPPIEYITQRGPFQDGVTVKDFFLGPRLIQLLIRQEFCDRLDWWDGRAALLDAIRPNRQLSATGVVPGVLEWCLPDGRRRQINTFITEGPRFEPRQIGTWDENSFQEALRFIAHDPLFFDPTEVVSSFALGLASDLIFPITFPIQFGSGVVSDTLNLTYVGTWKTFPAIVIVGPLEDPIIRNVTTGEKLQFSVDIPAGRTVTIDLAYGVKTVVDDLGNNLIGNLSADSNLATWHLAPDPEATDGLNVITLSGLNPTGATSVQLRYFTRYFGF